MNTLTQKVHNANEYAKNHFGPLLAIILTIFLICAIGLDWYAGFGFSNSFRFMIGQDITLQKDQRMFVLITNTTLMNLSPQPVTVKKNLATLTKIALFTRPEPFTIIYTEQMNIDESTVSFVCFEESNRRFYVSGSKPARGTIAVLYYLHYRDEIMPMDKEHQITDIDARGFAEVKAIMWVSVLNNRSYEEYQTALGWLLPYASSEDKDKEEYQANLKKYRALRGPVD